LGVCRPPKKPWVLTLDADRPSTRSLGFGGRREKAYQHVCSWMVMGMRAVGIVPGASGFLSSVDFS
jgi:hypothetical protein